MSGRRTGATRLQARGYVAPYTLLGAHYERLVGDAIFPAVRAGFEHWRRTRRLRLQSAADVGCGTGRFLAHLSHCAGRLFGVDRSPRMLAIAARRLRGSGVQLLRQDLRELKLPERVDLITCNGDTLNYLLSPADLAAALAAFAAALRPGGHLVCDVLSGWPPGVPQQALARTGPPSALRWHCRVDPLRRLTRVDVSTPCRVRGARRACIESHVQRWFDGREFESLLRISGFLPLAARRLDEGASPHGAWLQVLSRRQ